MCPAVRFTGLDMGEEVAALQAVLPRMAERAVTVVTVEVPGHAAKFSRRMGQIIQNAVQQALGAFPHLAVGAHGSDSPRHWRLPSYERGCGKHARAGDIRAAVQRI